MSEVHRTLMTMSGINVILAWGAYLVFKTGQITLGQAAFMAVGAYGSGVLTVQHGMPLVPAMLIAGVGSMIFGAVIAFPALRFRGMYLALVTIGLGQLVTVFFANFEYTGGVSGFAGPTGTTLGLVWRVVAVVGLFLLLLGRSRLGWAMDAVREDELAAASMGVNVTYIKVLAFALGGFVTAVGGALYAHYLLFIRPENFDFFASTLIVLFVVLGGMETAAGPAVGAIALTWLPELIRGLASWRLFVYGAILVAMMAFRPNGLVSRDIVRLPGRVWARFGVGNRPRASGAAP